MSDKDNKRIMQCLLIACAFVLVLLYLYFTKGACWEMKDFMNTIGNIAIDAILVLIGIIFITSAIFRFSKNYVQKSCLCYKGKSFVYISEKNSTVPAGIKTIVISDVDVLDNLMYEKKEDVEDIYIFCPSENISIKEMILLEGKTIHFCKDYSIFRVRTEKERNNNKQTLTQSSGNADGNAEKNNDEVDNSDEQQSSGGK